MHHRYDIRLSPDEIRSYLNEKRNITLVTNGPNGFPHAVAMFYALGGTPERDPTILFTTYAASQKARNIERDPRVTLLIESGRAYSELRGLMIQGLASISHQTEQIVATMIEANADTGSPLPDIDLIPDDVKQRMAGKRVLITIRPQRFVSWDHGKLPSGKTPEALNKTLR